ncbi:MAG: response regulator [Chloroflexota bacterium]
MLPRILIVEDDQTFRETVCEILRDVGYKVKGARTLKKATKRLKKHQFDLVLTDMHIGDDSGFQVIEVAQHKRPDAKIVMMSSLADPEVIHQGLESGAARFIAKPFRVVELLQTVEDLLGKTEESSEDPLDAIV